MGLPFAPNSVPLGMNPGGKRLTTRTHRFAHITDQCMLLGPNPHRLAVVITADIIDNLYTQISLTPDDESSWFAPYYSSYGSMCIYGGLAIYGRVAPYSTFSYDGIVIIEHVYE